MSEKQCIAGCRSYDGNETLHHPDCPYWPNSLSKMNAEIKSKLNKEVFDLNRKLGAAEKRQTELDFAVKRHVKTIAAKDKRIADLESHLDWLRKTPAAKLAYRCKDLEAQLAAMQKRHDAALENATKWGVECDELKAEIAALKAEVERLKEDIEQGFMKGAYARLQELQEAERQNAALRTEVATQGVLLDEVRGQRDSLRSRLEQAEGCLRDIASQCEDDEPPYKYMPPDRMREIAKAYFAAAPVAEQEQEAGKGACVWTWDDAGFYETECGGAWCFEVGGPKDNRATFCPYCGKPIKEAENDG